ncbi:MAG TPA: hypothetical protein VEZ48_01040 [Sphingomonadaceae bacterium]|nr:hypothetical protein [Sphingomonadaceae bacterium]
MLGLVPVSGAWAQMSAQDRIVADRLTGFRGEYLSTEGGRVTLKPAFGAVELRGASREPLPNGAQEYITLTSAADRPTFSGTWVNGPLTERIAGVDSDGNLLLGRNSGGTLKPYMLCKGRASDAELSYLGDGMWGKFAGARVVDGASGGKDVVVTLIVRNAYQNRATNINAFGMMLFTNKASARAASYVEAGSAGGVTEMRWRECGEVPVSFRFANVTGKPERAAPLMVNTMLKQWPLDLMEIAPPPPPPPLPPPPSSPAPATVPGALAAKFAGEWRVGLRQFADPAPLVINAAGTLFTLPAAMGNHEVALRPSADLASLEGAITNFDQLVGVRTVRLMLSPDGTQITGYRIDENGVAHEKLFSGRRAGAAEPAPSIPPNAPLPRPVPPRPAPPPSGPITEAPAGDFQPLAKWDVRLDRVENPRDDRLTHVYLTLRNGGTADLLQTQNVWVYLESSDGLEQKSGQGLRPVPGYPQLFGSPPPVVRPGKEIRTKFVFDRNEGASPSKVTVEEGGKEAVYEF